MARREWNWTSHQLDKLNEVKTILAELNEYLPLTLRQIYYQLVVKEIIENRVSEYTMLSKLLKYARIDGKIAWAAVEDRVRAVHRGEGWVDKEEFIEQELNDFLRGYRRDLVQGQDKFIEVWIEKDALSTVFARVTYKYGISTVVCRGFSSVTFLNDFKERVLSHTKQGKEALMLYFGDFDPSGNEMLRSMQETLVSEMNLDRVTFKRVALTQDDITKYRLPHNPNALKKTDTRARKHLEQYGALAVELDALKPNILEKKIKNAVERELDMDLLRAEQRKAIDELEELRKLKGKVVDFIVGGM